MTYGEKIPILNVTELITKFEKLVLSAKEILSVSARTGLNAEELSSFELLLNIVLTNASLASLQALTKFSMDDNEKLRRMKQSLNKVQNGDLSELSKELSAFSRAYDEIRFLSLLDLWIKEEHKEEARAQLLDIFTALYHLVNEFYESCKDSVIDFLRKVADILVRLIGANDIQDAVLMRKEFVIDAEDQLCEFNNKSKRSLSLILDKPINYYDKIIESFYDKLIKREEVEQSELFELLLDLLRIGRVKEFNEIRIKHHIYPNFSGADLSGANLSHADLERVYLLHTNLSSANLSHTNLRGIYLSHTDLSNTDLTEANLSGANLSGADLRDSIIIGVRYQDLKCVNADFKGAIIDDENLSIQLSNGNAKNVPPVIKNKEELRRGLKNRGRLLANVIDELLLRSSLPE